MTIQPPPPPSDPNAVPPQPASSPVAPAAPGYDASTQAPAQPVGKKSILPLLSIIFAGVAFLFAVIPPTSAIAWAFAITAIVLAIVALVKKAQPRILAIIAIILAPLAWLISIIVFVVSVAAGIGTAIQDDPGITQPTAVAPSEEAPAEEAPEEEAPAEPALGETITNNKGVAVTFSSVTCGIPAAGPEFLQETAKGQFCEVRYTVQNGSDEQINLWASDVTGEIGGVSYETNGTISQFGGDYFTTELNPGLGAEAVVYIDIPADKALDYVVYVPEWSLFTDEIRVKVG